MSKTRKTTIDDLIERSDNYITLVCDDCGDIEQYVRKDKLPEQIKKGWSVTDDKLLCPGCTKEPKI